MALHVAKHVPCCVRFRYALLPFFLRVQSKCSSVQDSAPVLGAVKPSAGSARCRSERADVGSLGAEQHGSPPPWTADTQHSHDGPSSLLGTVASASLRCRQPGSIHQSTARLVPLSIGFAAEEGLLLSQRALTAGTQHPCSPSAPARLLASATCSKGKVMSAVASMDFFMCVAVGDGSCWSHKLLGLLRVRELLADHPLSPSWEGTCRFWEPAPDHLQGSDLQHPR